MSDDKGFVVAGQEGYEEGCDGAHNRCYVPPWIGGFHWGNNQEIQDEPAANA